MKLPEISSCSWERDPGEYSKHELHPEMSLLTWFRTGVRFSSPPPEKSTRSRAFFNEIRPCGREKSASQVKSAARVNSGSTPGGWISFHHEAKPNDFTKGASL